MYQRQTHAQMMFHGVGIFCHDTLKLVATNGALELTSTQLSMMLLFFVKLSKPLLSPAMDARSMHIVRRKCSV